MNDDNLSDMNFDKSMSRGFRQRGAKKKSANYDQSTFNMLASN